MSDILSQIEEIQGNVRDIKATWGNTLMTLDNIKSSLKADRQKAIDEAYQKGFEAGQHEATTLEYQRGLEDGKKQAKAQAELDVCHDIEKVAREHFKKGLEDAWECAKRISLVKTDEDCPYFSVAELKKIFGCSSLQSVFDTYSASEAIEKVKAYEEQQQKADEIKVGDEVRNTLGLMDNAVGYVIGITIEGDYNVSRYIDEKIKTGTWRRENCVKTGKHSDTVVQLLAEMEGGAE